MASDAADCVLTGRTTRQHDRVAKTRLVGFKTNANAFGRVALKDTENFDFIKLEAHPML